MSNQKSIIGCGYIPRKAQAVCLKTNAITRLGEVEYKIIKDPYERTFKSEKNSLGNSAALLELHGGKRARCKHGFNVCRRVRTR